MKHIFLIVFVAVITLSACRKDEEFPLEPRIEFKELVKHTGSNGKDTAVTLTFTFTDGDGDIGLRQGEGGIYTGDYENNLYINYQKKEPGGEFATVYIPTPVDSIGPDGTVYVIIKNLPVQFTYRMPYMVPAGRNKAIKGDISVDINTYGFSPVSRFEFYIYDRALNRSNIEYTPEFSVN